MTRKAIDYLPLLRDVLGRDGRYWLPLAGNSMLPTLPAACDIEVVPTDAPRIGDLLVFALGDALVAHRLVGGRGEWLICQGDNRRAADPPLRREQVLGRVAGAWVDGARVWPGRGARAAATWWVARAWGWRGARKVRRMFGSRRAFGTRRRGA